MIPLGTAAAHAPLAALSDALADLVARAAPAVVGVEHRRGQGSGVVLAPDGWILTNAHVARAAGRPAAVAIEVLRRGARLPLTLRPELRGKAA